MKVLIVGGGAREHALAWKVIQSPLISELHVAPGNPGIGRFAWCHHLVKATDIQGQVALAQKIGADLVIVGPDDPLALGLVDALQVAGIRAFGPTKAAAQIEWSKSFAKELMRAAGIPTAAYASFTEYAAALAYLEAQGFPSGGNLLRGSNRTVLGGCPPIVIKADGLALGKGVRVCQTLEEARGALKAMMQEKAFGEAGATVVIEEFMTGPEVSVLALSDGTTIKQLISAQDHKRLYDGETGPNTGGMGAYAPVPFYTPEIAERVQAEILEPLVKALAERGAPFVGCLFAGLMLTPTGPKVVEFNARFGDPETEAVLPLMKTDLLAALVACVEGRLDQLALEFWEGACACVMLASAGYPGPYEKGLSIEGLAEADERGVTVFHAGTWVAEDGEIVTNGGRVVGVMAGGPTLEAALERAYWGVAAVNFLGKTYRRDIGWQAVQR